MSYNNQYCKINLLYLDYFLKSLNIQGYKGIRDKLMHISNDNTEDFTPSVDYNLWHKRLDTQLKDATSQNSIKVPKVGRSTNKKPLL